MAEARKVRLYIYNDTSKGDGLSLTSSQTFMLDDRKNVVTSVPVEYTDPNTGVKTSTTTTTTTVYSYEVTLTKLEYRKKVYEPCQILANIQIGVVQERTDVKTDVITTYTDGKTSTDTKTDKGHFVPVEMIGNDKINLIKGSTVELEIDGNSVAKNYYVHKVRSLYKTISGNTSLFVELTIFSRDKLMTLDKYSRAYTAKRLYSDILSDEALKFDSVEVANHMQLLKYQDTSTKATARDELRIPYLVQYNESFYQFMVRSANRFGEFLYFEDGKLNLGMQPSETNYYSGDTAIDWATKPNAVQNRYYESVIAEGISVEERGYSYLTHKPDENEEYASSDDRRYNIDPTSAGEWTDQELEKNKYIEFTEAFEEELKCYVVEAVFKGLESQSLGEAITSIILGVGKMAYDVHRNNKDYNNLLDDSNYDTIENDDQKSGDSYKQFVTYSGSDKLSSNLLKLVGEGGINNFTDLFYQLIRKKEKELGEQAVWLDFGNYYFPIKLGDKLYVDKKDYVVISVEGSYENGQEHLLVSAIPVYSLSDTISTPQTATTAGDPWTTSCPLPPALPDVLISDARPQVAFVSDFMDPGNLGRIRVRYPWQDGNGDMSPWIRVTLPLATTGGSVNFTPSIGDEVMVGYMHGNIEHPYGMGYLTAPFVNERWKNAIPFDQYGGLHGIKVKTGHHLTFTDGANAANMVASLLGGPFNFVKSFWPTGALGAWPMGNEKTSDFGGGFELSDRYGFYKITGSTDDRNITIASPLGTVNLNAFQGISIEAPNGEIEIKGKNVSIEASNRLSLKSGENIENKLWYRKQWLSSVSGSFGALGLSAWSEGKNALLTLKSSFYEQFLDVSFLRCLFEWFLIPVNGTLSIKSATFVTLEAGEGAVEVPHKSLRYGKGIKDELNDLDKLNHSLELISLNLSPLIEGIKYSFARVCETTASINVFNSEEDIISYSSVLMKEGKFSTNDTDFKFDTSSLRKIPDDVYVEPKAEDYTNGKDDPKYIEEHGFWKTMTDRIPFMNSVIDINRESFARDCEKLRINASDLYKAVSKLTGFKKTDFKLKLGNITLKEGDIDVDAAVDAINALTIPTKTGIVSLNDMENKSYTKSIKMPEEAVWDQMKSAMIRFAIVKYLKSQSYLNLDKSKISSVDDAYNNNKWKEFVASIEDSYTFDWGKKRTKANEIFNPLCGIIDDHLQWSHGFKGKILMSDEVGKTAFFDDGLNLKPHFHRDHYDNSLNNFRSALLKY